MVGNGWVYETFGISMQLPIKPLQCLLNVPPLKLALSAKCFIYRVPNWPLFLFNQLAVNFAVPRALGQTHPLPSFVLWVGWCDLVPKAFGLCGCLALAVFIFKNVVYFS